MTPRREGFTEVTLDLFVYITHHCGAEEAIFELFKEKKVLFLPSSLLDITNAGSS